MTKGFTLIETLIGMTILVIVSSALYLAYSNTLDIVTAGQYHSAAANIIESEVEAVRNMDYEDIGTVGGIPSGKIPQSKTIAMDGSSFLIKAFVRNIDDPFDGVLGGAPNDTAPADYKLVEFQVQCPACPRFGLVRMTTTVAPRNLESSAGTGNLFINVLNSLGQPLAGATVTVVNTTVSPTINLTDITGANGQLQLVGVPTSSAGYEVTVTKAGHSTDRTYAPGAPANPNPVKPHVTVAKEQLTISTFSIDRTAALNVQTRDQLCAAVPGFDFLLTGGKLIGTAPDVYKYSLAHATDAGGSLAVSGLEWDTYTFSPADAASEIAVMSSLSPATLNADETESVTWLIQPRLPSSLAIKVRDGSGTPVNDAMIELTRSGFSAQAHAGRRSEVHTDWSGGQYTDKSSQLETGVPGILTLAEIGGIYPTSSEWLISQTVDFGTADVSLFSLAWNPTTQPAQTEPGALRFQIAANNDDTTWNFTGPDGTAGTYFTSSGASLPESLNGNRYLRYKAYLQTDDEQFTPSVEDVAFAFRSSCVPGGGASFNGLSNGTYTVTVTKQGFQTYTDTNVVVNSDWRTYGVTLIP